MNGITAGLYACQGVQAYTYKLTMHVRSYNLTLYLFPASISYRTKLKRSENYTSGIPLTHSFWDFTVIILRTLASVSCVLFCSALLFSVLLNTLLVDHALFLCLDRQCFFVFSPYLTQSKICLKCYL